MSRVSILESTLTDIADAIREQLDTEDTYKPSEMANAIESISGGGSATLDDVAIRNYTETNMVVPNATRLVPYAFYGCGMTSFSAPNVTIFSDKATGSGVGSYVFANCTNLTTVSMPKLVGTGSGGYQFNKCTSLVNVDMKNVACGQHMFDGCTALVEFASAHSGAMNGYGFNGCTKLERVDLNVSALSTQEFNNCSKLSMLVLRRTAGVPTLSNINAFNNTPFASGKAGGTLYVPNDLIASYQSASNWSTILGYANNQIKSIESTHTDLDAPIDLTLYYADGELIPTS